MTERERDLAAALGRVPSGLFVVTARRGDDESGMLASWVQQCSFHPPHLCVAIRRERTIADWLTKGSIFVVNILGEMQTDMIVHFGRGFERGENVFEGVEVHHPDGSAPVLTEALAYLECRVAGRHPVGDHDLFLGEVIGGRVLGDGKPMIHLRKSGMHY